MAGSLPIFRYHPDPIATGSVEPSPAECRSCDQARGFIYVGPVRQEASAWGWSDRQAAVHVDSLVRGGSPAAYLSRCLVCGSHLAYSEFD